MSAFPTCLAVMPGARLIAAAPVEAATSGPSFLVAVAAAVLFLAAAAFLILTALSLAAKYKRERRSIEEVRVDAAVLASERDDLRSKLTALETALEEQRRELDEHRTRELQMRAARAAAEKAARELLEQAEREAEATVTRARRLADESVATATRERDDLRAQTDRLQALAAELKNGYRAFLLAAHDLLQAEDAFRFVPDPPAREKAADVEPGRDDGQPSTRAR